MPSAAFWPAVAGGTEEYRCRVPAQALTRLGWDAAVVHSASEVVGADVVVLQRVVDEQLPDLIRSLRRRGTLVVYDIDDWYDNVPGYNPAGRNITPIIDLVHEAMRNVDVITCSTSELAEGYSRLGRTVVLPNFLDPDLWSTAELGRYRPDRSKVHVGWAGHVGYRSADLDLLRPWLAGWLDRNPDVVFVACGGPGILEYLEVPGLASPKTETGEFFRPYDHLPVLLTWLDVGLVPLVYNRFNEAKSWCKGMEYGAAGVPAVASPSREYRKYITPGVNGYLVRRNEWAAALDRTLDDLDALRVGARRVAEEHMIDRHIGRWVDVYSGALVAA